jgi:hypothetical protein
MQSAPWLSVFLVGLGSFLLGCAVPILYYWVIPVVQRALKATRTSWITTLSALIVSLGVTSAGLVYLSTTHGGQPKVIVIAYMIGVALVRWLRGDYRYSADKRV